LARLVDYSGQEVAPVSMGLFQNRLGGRICVAGYFPWTFLHSLSKSAQMKSVMRWLSRDQMPAYVGSFHKINLWSRQLQDEAGPLAMTNSSHDTATNVIFWMRTDKQQIRVVDMDCQKIVIATTGTDGPYRKFIIPVIGPWQMRLVICQ